jgi:hypothetical protein
MAYNFLYMPAFRSRQQELLVLKSFDFGDRITPLIEIIKEKDRIDNNRSVEKIWQELVSQIESQQLLIDLPTYYKRNSAMSKEVVAFELKYLSNLNNRLSFFQYFLPFKDKVIPVVSSLLTKTGEADTIKKQAEILRKQFPCLAFRLFVNGFDDDVNDVKQTIQDNDILIYDYGTPSTSNVLIKMQVQKIQALNCYKVGMCSAINKEVQNKGLTHGAVVPEADNILLETFKQPPLRMNAFGDYAGIKKDELSSGGTISPGFVMYNPADNLYYGFTSDLKKLSEFKDTIVPAVLKSDIITQMNKKSPSFLNADNLGWVTINNIAFEDDNGKSQAKFKRISMEHYLHCVKQMIINGEIK